VPTAAAWPQLTVVSAPAGAGKTHLVRASTRGDRTVFLSLRDQYDGTELPTRLVRHLRTRVPSLPGWLSAAVGPTCGPVTDHDPQRRSEQLGSLIGHELTVHLHRPMTLVIDELELIDDDPGAMRFVESLVRTAPPALSIVLVTRTAIGFAVNRLRADDRVLEIGPSDLALDDDRARAVVIGRWPTLGAWADRIIAAGDGRPGPILTLSALVDAIDPDERDGILRRLDDQDGVDVAARAAQLLHDRLDDADRRLLDDLAVVGRATPNELDRLGGHDDAKRLDDLVRAGLVEYTADIGGQVRLARVIANTVADADPVARHREQRHARADDAVRGAIVRGDPISALRIARRHGDEELLRDTVLRYAGAAIDNGGGRLVLDAVRDLDDPTLAGVAGRAAQALGAWEDAIGWYERAAVAQVTSGDAWRHGLIEYFRGDPVAARRAYERGIEAASADDEPGERARLLGYGGAVAWLSGDLETARDRAHESLEMGTALGDDGALAVAYTLAAMVAASDGDRVGNDWNYVRALQHAERAGDLLQIARIRSNRGSRLLEEGDYESALDELDDAVRYAEAGGYDGMLALALSNRGQVAIQLGRLDDARNDLTVSIDLLQRQGTQMVAYPLVQLARLFTARGDVEQARGACERALAIIEHSDDRQIEVAALNQLALTMAQIDPEVAWRDAQRAVAVATVSLDAAEAWTIVARLALVRGDTDEAARAAVRATELARTRRDRYALGTALEVHALVQPEPAARRRILHEAFTLFDELGCPIEAGRVELRLAEERLDALAVTRVAAVADQARRLGARPLLAQAEELLERHDSGQRGALAVTALGTFSLSLRGEPIPVRRWQSKKSRDLFKMLVSLRGRALPRDLAFERLWPEDDPSKASSKLSVALATMRSVLDPDKEFPADHYVRAEGDAIVLDAATVPTDIDEFLRGAASALAELKRQRGERAIAMLAAVEARYHGDVFEDDPYVDWFVPLREEARAVYLNVARELASIRAERGDPDDAIRLYLRLLEREPFDESAHLALVRALSAVGRHGDARRRYQRYADRMRELDLEPRSFAAAVGTDRPD
jgi:DNA-binding SARP family transcriptional activator/ATP/maltotriose-dependent transcriptional regulator MalT